MSADPPREPRWTLPRSETHRSAVASKDLCPSEVPGMSSRYGSRRSLMSRTAASGLRGEPESRRPTETA